MALDFDKLRRYLKSEIWEECCEAITQLGDLGNRRAVPLLLDALEDLRGEISCTAFETLLQMKITIADIEPRLAHPDEYIRGSAVQLISWIGPSTIPTLAGLLDDGSADVRLTVVNSLAEMCVQAAVPILEKALADKDPYVRGRARSGIDEIMNPVPESLAFDICLDDIHDANPDLSMMMKKTDNTALKAILSDSGINCYEREGAALELGERCDFSAISLLVDAMGDQEYHVRGAACIALDMVLECCETSAELEAFDDALLRAMMSSKGYSTARNMKCTQLEEKYAEKMRGALSKGKLKPSKGKGRSKKTHLRLVKS